MKFEKIPSTFVNFVYTYPQVEFGTDAKCNAAETPYSGGFISSVAKRPKGLDSRALGQASRFSVPSSLDPGM